MENDYDRSEDDAWHGRIAAGRILSDLAAERLRAAPRPHTRRAPAARLCGTGGGTKNAKPEVMFVKGEHKSANIKRSERYEKLRCPRGLIRSTGPPREAPRGGCKPATTSVAAVTCGVVTGRTARGAETGARGRNRHACSPDRASTPFGTLVALEHRGLSVVLGGTFRLHISAGQLSPARRVATIFS